MWHITYLKILVCMVLGHIPSELDDPRNLNYNEQLTSFFSLCKKHYRLNLMFTLYQQYTYKYLALERYNQNFFDQTYAPSTCRQNAIMGNNALDLSAHPSTSGLGATPSISAPSTCRQIANMGNNALDLSAHPSTSGLGATPSISAPSAFPSSAASFNTLIAPGAASSSTAALYTPVASISGSNMSRKRKYTDGKPFECTYEGCNKKFSRVGHLNDHINTHENKRPYKCRFCNRRFNALNCLNAHINTHENKRPYKCRDCNRRFNSTGGLSNHRRVDHKDLGSFSCPNCDKKFLNEKSLNIHQAKKHNK